mmetsp:Transcript_27181/g.58198  ORF Transcript_27181/g.58198 Transcript_27181/m.58198 type:complete len:203 (+) Transcript_27181:579-1187(+)
MMSKFFVSAAFSRIAATTRLHPCVRTVWPSWMKSLAIFAIRSRAARLMPANRCPRSRTWFREAAKSPCSRKVRVAYFRKRSHPLARAIMLRAPPDRPVDECCQGSCCRCRKSCITISRARFSSSWSSIMVLALDRSTTPRSALMAATGVAMTLLSKRDEGWPSRFKKPRRSRRTSGTAASSPSVVVWAWPSSSMASAFVGSE